MTTLERIEQVKQFRRRELESAEAAREQAKAQKAAELDQQFAATVPDFLVTAGADWLAEFFTITSRADFERTAQFDVPGHAGSCPALRSVLGADAPRPV